MYVCESECVCACMYMKSFIYDVHIRHDYDARNIIIIIKKSMKV